MENENLEILKMIKDNHYEELEKLKSEGNVTLESIKKNSISNVKHPKKMRRIILNTEKFDDFKKKCIISLISVGAAASIIGVGVVGYNNTLYFKSDIYKDTRSVVSENTFRTESNEGFQYDLNSMATGILASDNVDQALIIALDFIKEYGVDNINELFYNLNLKDPNFKYKNYNEFINAKGKKLNKVIDENMNSIIENEKEMKGRSL